MKLQGRTVCKPTKICQVVWREEGYTDAQGRSTWLEKPKRGMVVTLKGYHWAGDGLASIGAEAGGKRGARQGASAAGRRTKYSGKKTKQKAEDSRREED